MSTFTIGNKTEKSRKIIILSFQKINRSNLYEKYFTSKEFHDILLSVDDGHDLMKGIDILEGEKTFCIAWVYHNELPLSKFKKSHSHLLTNNWERYWFIEQEDESFEVIRIHFPTTKVNEEVKNNHITDEKRRKILNLPTPSDNETDYKLIVSNVPYIQRGLANRFFKLSLFKKSVVKMTLDQVNTLTKALGITQAKNNILYFDTKEDLLRETKEDYGRYGSICSNYWTKEE